MGNPFAFAALTADVERGLVAALGLTPLPLAPELVQATGTWKGESLTIETGAYQGGPVAYARFARIVGPSLEIGNVLCLPAATYPLPILGADLVGLGRQSGMVAADLSPTLPPGPERNRQLARLAARRDDWPPLPPGGPLPEWCQAWFSPYALYTRVGPAQAADAARAFRDFPAAFVELARTVAPRPDLATAVAAALDGYAAAHRTQDKGLGLLARMFEPAWAARYLAQVLFPSSEMLPCRPTSRASS